MNSNILELDEGSYLFNLENILKKKKISKNKLIKETNTDFKVVQRLIKGNITKIDIYVIARLCSYLNCNLTDIIDFKRKKNIKN